MKGTNIAKVDGLEDWEIGLLLELRLLRDAGALEPVLEAMTMAMTALLAEAERADERQRAGRLQERIEAHRKNKRAMAEALRKAKETTVGQDVTGLRDAVATKTHAGRMLGRHKSRFTTADAMWAMCQQIARASTINAANRLRRYVFGSA